MHILEMLAVSVKMIFVQLFDFEGIITHIMCSGVQNINQTELDKLNLCL